jgi:hypothetical protein
MSDLAKEPIAIIRSGCRFPGDRTKTLDMSFGKFPPERLNAAGFYHFDGMYHDSTNFSESYPISADPRLFDAQFFKIKPVVANSVNLQQRLLME